MAEVLTLVPNEVGENFRFDADKILEAAKGRLSTVVVIGETEDGEMWVSASANAGESFILMERAKLHLLSAD